MKYRKLLLTALMTACGATSYASAVDYKAGSCYVCKYSQDGALLRQLGLMSLVKTAWQEAWTEECKDPDLTHNL